MKRFKTLLSILLVVVMVCTLFACGKSDTTTEDKTPQDKSTAQTTSTDTKGGDDKSKLENPTVRFLMWDSPDYEKVIKTFEEKYGGKIIHEKATWGSIYTKLVAAISAGNAPDATFMHAAWYPSYPNKNLVQPVDDLLDKNDPIWDLSYMDKFKWNGKYYGLCTRKGFDLHVIFYNKTMFKNNGLKTPTEYYDEGQWNWDNFSMLAQELTQDTDNDGTTDIYGFTTCNLEDFIMNNGGQLVQFEGTNLKLSLDDPKVIQGLEFARDLRQKYKVMDSSMGIENLVNGKSAMVSNGVWVPRTNFQGFKDEWDIVPYPKSPNTQDNIMVGGGWSYVIPTGAKNPKGGVLFIKTLFETIYGPDVLIEKDSYTEEQHKRMDKMRERTDFTRVFGIGDFGNSYWGYFDEIFNQGLPIATVNAKYTPLFQTAIDNFLKDNQAPKITPFEGAPKADFESGDLQYIIPVPDGDSDKVEITKDANEAIEGTSAKLTSGAASGWAAIAQTDPAKVKLPAKHTYHIKFSYKIVTAPGKDGEFGLCVRQKDAAKDVADVKNFGGYTAITGASGDKGEIDINIPAPDGSDENCIVFFANNGGSIVIDNLTIVED